MLMELVHLHAQVTDQLDDIRKKRFEELVQQARSQGSAPRPGSASASGSGAAAAASAASAVRARCWKSCLIAFVRPQCCAGYMQAPRPSCFRGQYILLHIMDSQR